MRDVLVIIIFAVALPFALRRPLVGLLVYFWISIMNPHRYGWGFATKLPLAQIAALVTFLSCMINLSELKFPKNRSVYLFFLFWGFITFTTLYSLYPETAWEKWKLVSKIFLMTYLAMVIVTTREKFFYFVLAIIAYVGFVGVKGAIFGLQTGGQYKIWGPPGSFLEDNNDMGLALVMVIPACFFLKDQLTKKWYAYGIMGMGAASIVSAVLTYSRGALVGLAAIGLFFLFKTKRKIAVFTALVVVAAISISVLPAHWFERMNTLATYKSDGSANQRIDSWIFSYRLARAHAFGGGFECFTPDQYFLYSPNPSINVTDEEAHTAHSIYFQVLAEHGFGGLALFMACLFSSLLSLKKLDRIARYFPEGAWISHYTKAFSLSIAGFMICGAFLSRAYFDLFWIIFAATVCLQAIVFSGGWIEEKESVTIAEPVAPLNPVAS